MHPRILIEALVTLTQAGWVSFSSQEGSGFLLTSEGVKATDENESPSTITVASRTAFFLLERLTGDIIGNEEVWLSLFSGWPRKIYFFGLYFWRKYGISLVWSTSTGCPATIPATNG